MASDEPSTLRPVCVEKPWGREVWYSGNEPRGESGVVTAAGVVPLSGYLEAHGRASPVILLKALRPTVGDLYLEVHETKSEVYVVDRIDGAGRMLLGSHPDVLARMDAEQFRAALRRVAAKVEAGEVGVEAVQSFMKPVDLDLGDAVTIPSGVPHSLLRGVHVIEFQTPVFERRILAASQPVVTQQGWDVDAAVDAMDVLVQPRVERRREDEVRIIAQAPGFAVTRYRRRTGAAFGVPPWSVGWVVRGKVSCGERCFEARTAFIAPSTAEFHAEFDTEVLVATEA